MWRVGWSVSATRERTREQKKEDSQVKKKKISLHIVNQKLKYKCMNGLNDINGDDFSWT